MFYKIIINDSGNKGIECQACKRISYNRNDIKYEYCGHCHKYFTQDENKVLWHGTTLENFEGMLKEGKIIPGMGGIYLSEDRRDAIAYAFLKAYSSRKGSAYSNPIVMGIDPRRLDTDFLYNISEQAGEYKCYIKSIPLASLNIDIETEVVQWKFDMDTFIGLQNYLATRASEPKKEIDNITYEGNNYPFSSFKVCVPEGKSGDWKIKKFKVLDQEVAAFNLHSQINSFSTDRNLVSGEYTKLVRNGEVIMSDVPAEIRDHLPFLVEANGTVLINGLGLGMALNYLLKKSDVVHVTVIEKSKDVINLSGEYYKQLAKSVGKELDIINEDAFKFKPKLIYDYAWHDIWDTISDLNIKEMNKLEKKYYGMVEKQWSWCRPECERMKRMLSKNKNPV